jgi:hypothetical protein
MFCGNGDEYFGSLLIEGCMNEWMYEEWATIVRPLYRDLQWSILLPLSFINPTLRMKCRTLFVGESLSSMKNWPKWRNLNEAMASQSHRICVADHLLLGTFHREERPSIPVWKDVLLGDRVLWIVLPPILIGLRFNFKLIVRSSGRGYWRLCLSALLLDAPSHATAIKLMYCINMGLYCVQSSYSVS